MLASGRNATQTARSYLRAYKAPHVGLRQHKQPTKFSQYASRDTQNGWNPPDFRTKTLV